MKKELLQNNLLKIIHEKVPNKTMLANILMDLLCIEKEAVYRRLRSDVVFTFSEIALIANHFGISIDNIISSTLSSKSKPFQLKLVNYNEPTEIDYVMMQQYLDILEAGKDDPRSKLVDCTNTLPLALCLGYKNLEQFLLFKSLYQSGNTNAIRNFHEVTFDKRMYIYLSDVVRATKQIKNSYYIFDPFIFRYLVNDINYYQGINLIQQEDVEALKKDLKCLINELETQAVHGIEKDSGNKIYMYVASLNFDLSYWYFDVDTYHVSLLKAFVLNNFSSLDEESFDILRARIETLMRSSTMISVSGERQRLEFFNKQREMIDAI